jgi:hypothetical protein
MLDYIAASAGLRSVADLARPMNPGQLRKASRAVSGIKVPPLPSRG